MGLISKIEDKLSHSNKNEEPNKLEKPARSSYENTGSSKIQNPISSAEKHGTGLSSSGVPGTGGTISGMKQAGAISSAEQYGSDMNGKHGHGHGHHGHGTHDRKEVPGAVDRDGYGAQTSGAYGGSSGAYGSQTVPHSTSDRYGGTTTGTTTTTTTTGDQYSSGGPREPYDPYSSKGQRTAADAVPAGAGYGTSHSSDPRYGQATGAGYGSTGTSAQDYGSRSAVDPDVSRSRHGGVTNSMDDDPRYGGTSGGNTSTRRNEDAIPTAGGQRLGTSGSGYDSGANTGSAHHYGRDAAVAGGAGAAGIGAYEASKMHGSHHTGGTHPSSYDQPSSGISSGRTYDQPSTGISSGHGYDQPSSGVSGGRTYDQQPSGIGGQTYQDPTTAARTGQLGGGSSGGYGQAVSTGGPSDVSYMGRSSGGNDSSSYEPQGRSSYETGGTGTTGATSTSGGLDSSPTAGNTSSTGGSSGGVSAGLSQAKKMGGAYERGYQDAMEHLQAELGKKL